MQKEKEKKPIIMARVVRVEELLQLVACKEEKKLVVEIEDDLLKQNNGIYQLEISLAGSRVTKLTQYQTPQQRWKAEQLAPQVLQKVWINEIV